MFSLGFFSEMEFRFGFENRRTSMNETNVQRDLSKRFGQIVVAIFHLDKRTFPEVRFVQRFFRESGGTLSAILSVSLRSFINGTAGFFVPSTLFNWIKAQKSPRVDSKAIDPFFIINPIDRKKRTLQVNRDEKR